MSYLQCLFGFTKSGEQQEHSEDFEILIIFTILNLYLIYPKREFARLKITCRISRIRHISLVDPRADLRGAQLNNFHFHAVSDKKKAKIIK